MVRRGLRAMSCKLWMWTVRDRTRLIVTSKLNRIYSMDAGFAEEVARRGLRATNVTQVEEM